MTGTADRDTKKKSRNHSSGSFLVRFWVEPSAGPDEQALRGCIRNLQTGEEHYVKDPGKIGDVVLRHLGSQGKGEQESEDSVGSGSGRSSSS